MEISTNSFSPGGPIPSRYALARPDGDERAAVSTRDTTSAPMSGVSTVSSTA